MDKYYLTENIFINNDNYYYNDKLMNNNNWHNLLFEIGWEKLPIQFIKTLNKLSNKRNKNSQFAVMDCGDDDDDTVTPPSGESDDEEEGLAVAGFVIAIVALVFVVIIAIVAMVVMRRKY